MILHIIYIHIYIYHLDMTNIAMEAITMLLSSVFTIYFD